MIGALLLWAGALAALEVPAPPNQFYTDAASLLTSSDAAALNSKLAAFEQHSGAQFIIYVFRSLEGQAVEDFTIRCAERWKVGNKKYDNGVILFVFVEERKVRIEVGYGLEGTITDAFSSRVIRDVIGPRFRNRDYAAGLNAAAGAIISRIEGKEAPVEPASRGASGEAAKGTDPIFLLIISIVFFVFILPILRRRGGCRGCFLPMFWPGGGGGITFGGGGLSGGGGWGGGGGFSGGGGGFGGGGATGGW